MKQVADEEQPKMQEEVVESKAAIGSMDYDKGTDDPNAEMPDVMPTEDQKIVEEKIEPFLVVEQMPDFPGGEAGIVQIPGEKHQISANGQGIRYYRYGIHQVCGK